MSGTFPVPPGHRADPAGMGQGHEHAQRARHRGDRESATGRNPPGSRSVLRAAPRRRWRRHQPTEHCRHAHPGTGLRAAALHGLGPDRRDRRHGRRGSGRRIARSNCPSRGAILVALDERHPRSLRHPAARSLRSLTPKAAAQSGRLARAARLGGAHAQPRSAGGARPLHRRAPPGAARPGAGGLPGHLAQRPGGRSQRTAQRRRREPATRRGVAGGAGSRRRTAGHPVEVKLAKPDGPAPRFDDPGAAGAQYSDARTRAKERRRLPGDPDPVIGRPFPVFRGEGAERERQWGAVPTGI